MKANNNNNNNNEAVKHASIIIPDDDGNGYEEICFSVPQNQWNKWQWLFGNSEKD